MEQYYFVERSALRNWLKENHDKSPGFWLVCYKKHTGKACITYDDAVEEALCFGWIDSIVKRVDDAIYLRKFTPRVNVKNWSDPNKIRVLKLIRNGSMTEWGLRKIDVFLQTGTVNWNKNEILDKKNQIIQIPDFILEEFKKNEPAFTNFQKLTESKKREYIGWINSAKRQETIRKRLNEAIQLLKINQKPGMK